MKLLKIFGTGLIGLIIISFLILTINIFSMPANYVKNLLPTPLKFAGVEFLITIIFAFLLGLAVSYFSNRIKHVPLIGHLFYSIKELSNAQPVLIPSLWGYGKMLGFLTPEKLTDPQTGKQLVGVFVPSTPNPTTGMIVWLQEEKVIIIPRTERERFCLQRLPQNHPPKKHPPNIAIAIFDVPFIHLMTYHLFVLF
jgi:uncharacterized membrane protein